MKNRAKRVTVNKKLINKIAFAISVRLDLQNTKELSESVGYELFESAPDLWTDFEKAVADYKGRINNEIMGDIKNILGYAEL